MQEDLLMSKENITFRSDRAKKEVLEAITTRLKSDRCSVVNAALEAYLELCEWQVAESEKGLELASSENLASEEDVKTSFEPLIGDH
jgi:predicted transcriptional regulator